MCNPDRNQCVPKTAKIGLQFFFSCGELEEASPFGPMLSVVGVPRSRIRHTTSRHRELDSRGVLPDSTHNSGLGYCFGVYNTANESSRRDAADGYEINEKWFPTRFRFSIWSDSATNSPATRKASVDGARRVHDSGVAVSLKDTPDHLRSWRLRGGAARI